MAKSLGEAADGVGRGNRPHRLDGGRARGKESRGRIAHLVKEFADLSQKLSDNLPMLEALLGAAGGSAIGSRFGGPFGALLGGLIGGFMPGAVKAENDPSGHSADSRKGAGGSVMRLDGLAAVRQTIRTFRTLEILRS